MTQQQAEAAVRAQRTGLRARRAGLALALGLATYFWLLTFADPSWAPRTTTAYGVLLAAVTLFALCDRRVGWVLEASTCGAVGPLRPATVVASGGERVAVRLDDAVTRWGWRVARHQRLPEPGRRVWVDADLGSRRPSPLVVPSAPARAAGGIGGEDGIGGDGGIGRGGGLAALGGPRRLGGLGGLGRPDGLRSLGRLGGLGGALGVGWGATVVWPLTVPLREEPTRARRGPAFPVGGPTRGGGVENAPEKVVARARQAARATLWRWVPLLLVGAGPAVVLLFAQLLSRGRIDDPLTAQLAVATVIAANFGLPRIIPAWELLLAPTLVRAATAGPPARAARQASITVTLLTDGPDGPDNPDNPGGPSNPSGPGGPDNPIGPGGPSGPRLWAWTLREAVPSAAREVWLVPSTRPGRLAAIYVPEAGRLVFPATAVSRFDDSEFETG